MKLSTKIAYNSFIQAGGKIISTALGLATVAIMTRYLGQFGFGVYTTIFTFLSFFAIIADLGITLVTIQMISKPGIDENRVLSNLFTLRFFTALLFLLLAPICVIFFDYSPEVKFGVALGAVTFLFPAMNQVLVGLFQKRLRMDKDSIAEIAGRFVLLIGAVLAYRYDLGLTGIIISMIISNFVNFLLHYIFAKKYSVIRFAFDTQVWKEILERSWPLAITITFNLIYLKTDTLILSLMKSANDVGIYGAAYKIIEVLCTIPYMFAGIILPLMASSWSEGNKEKYQEIFQRSMDVMIMLSLPLMVGTQFLASHIMSLMGGQEFRVSGIALRILALAAGSVFIGCMPAHALIAVDKQKKMIGAYIFTAITALFGYFIFIPKFSYVGAAWVTVYSEAAIALFIIYLLIKYVKISFNFRVTLKSAFATLVMAIVLFQIAAWNVFLSLTAAMAVYFAVMILIGGISKKFILDLVNKA